MNSKSSRTLFVGKCLVLVGVATSVALMSGCTGEHSKAVAAEAFQVEGNITFPDKTPLRGGVIYFSPTDASGGAGVRYEATALIDAKGHYILGFNGDNTGAPAGECKVTIMPRDYMELRNSNSANIPQKYQEKSTSPLVVTVLEGVNNFDFVLNK